MCGQNGSGTDPNRAVSFFYSSTGNANVWGYKNDRVDELCALGITTTDEETREGYYKEAQQLIIDECPNLWFASPMSYLFTSANLKGYEPFAANAATSPRRTSSKNRFPCGGQGLPLPPSSFFPARLRLGGLRKPAQDVLVSSACPQTARA